MAGLLSTPVQTVSDVVNTIVSPTPAPSRIIETPGFSQPQSASPQQQQTPSIFLVEPGQQGALRTMQISQPIDIFAATPAQGGPAGNPNAAINGIGAADQQGNTPNVTSLLDLSSQAPQILPMLPPSDNPATYAVTQATSGLSPVPSVSQELVPQTGSGTMNTPTASPINLLAPSLGTLVSGLAKGWTGGNTLYEDAAALAQTQSNRNEIDAQIQALNMLDAAGLCGQDCTNALASLQSSRSVTQARVDALTKAVANDQTGASSTTALPSPATQMGQIVSDIVNTMQEVVSSGNSGTAAPGASSSGNAAAQSGAIQYPGVPVLPLPGKVVAILPAETASSSYTYAYQNETSVPVVQVASDNGTGMAGTGSQNLLSGDGIGKLILNAWNFITNFFMPQPQAAAAAPAPSCSLLLSLFGGCR